jgi:hypothetical protein
MQSITADPWGEPRDLEALHADTARAILQAVEDLRAAVRSGAPGRARPRPLVVLGTAGSGKTHLFSRLRRKLGQRAILVHIRPIMSAEMTPRYVLGEVLQQVARVNGGVRQIDSLVGSTMAMGLDGSADQAGVGLELLRRLTPEGRRENLDLLCSRLLERMPALDDGYLERLLAAPFLDTLPFRATLAWLGGRDISETQAARIGVRQPLDEDRILPALRTVAHLAAPGAPLVVVFDQLENLVQGGGDSRILPYGNLIMELVDQVQDLVIVQMALDTEWQEGIRPALSLAQQARVVGPTFTLELPGPELAEGLVRVWSADVLEPGGPFPWPFRPGEIQAMVERQATPRMLLQAFQDRLAGEPAPEVRAADDRFLARAWEDRLAQARTEIDDQDHSGLGVVPETLADGLIHWARLVPGLALVAAQGPEDLRFRTPGGVVQVALVHQAHPRAIAAALDRLAGTQGPRLGLRELWRPFQPTWSRIQARWEALVRQGGACWHWLERKEVERLLALDRLLKAAASGDLSGPDGAPCAMERVTDWVRSTLAPQDWGLARLLVRTEAVPAPADGAPPAPVPDPGPPADAGAPGASGLERLRLLRVASIDRLLRECRRDGQALTRKELVADLKRAGSGIIWIGEGIVGVED